MTHPPTDDGKPLAGTKNPTVVDWSSCEHHQGPTDALWGWAAAGAEQPASASGWNRRSCSPAVAAAASLFAPATSLRRFAAACAAPVGSASPRSPRHRWPAPRGAARNGARVWASARAALFLPQRVTGHRLRRAPRHPPPACVAASFANPSGPQQRLARAGRCALNSALNLFCIQQQN